MRRRSYSVNDIEDTQKSLVQKHSAPSRGAYSSYHEIDKDSPVGLNSEQKRDGYFARQRKSDTDYTDEDYARWKKRSTPESDQVLEQPSLNEVLEKKFIEIRNMTDIAKNTLYPQLPLPDDVICTLSKNNDSYFISPINGDLFKVPTGLVNFAILEEDPLKVFCFEHDEVYSRKELREKTNQFSNYGHSSLAFREDWLKRATDKNYSLDERTSRSTRRVLLAGTMIFPDHDIPYEGGGQLLSWSNDSGHFKPTEEQALKNRFGFVKELLPTSKFIPFAP